jgi:hypothetical protein
MFTVPEDMRVRTGPMASDESHQYNGLFIVPFEGRRFRVIASNGGGWEHVSVSIPGEKRTPTWDEMCHIKDRFWTEGDVVIQYHPTKEDYVNHHPYTLHLWRREAWNGARDIETPPTWMIGPRIND